LSVKGVNRPPRGARDAARRSRQVQHRLQAVIEPLLQPAGERPQDLGDRVRVDGDEHQAGHDRIADQAGRLTLGCADVDESVGQAVPDSSPPSGTAGPTKATTTVLTAPAYESDGTTTAGRFFPRWPEGCGNRTRTRSSQFM